MKKIVNGLMAICLVTLIGCAGGGSPAIGTWNIEMTSPLGPLPAVLVINEDGTGNLSSENLGDAQISGIAFDGNAINFPLNLDVLGTAIALQFSGTVTGDALEGVVQSDFGPLAITGSRQ